MNRENELRENARQGLETMSREELMNLCMLHGDYKEWHEWEEISKNSPERNKEIPNGEVKNIFEEGWTARKNAPLDPDDFDGKAFDQAWETSITKLEYE